MPIEWWDEFKQFHVELWNEADGYIERCYANDPRNKDGKTHYTSLIMDAFKDIDLQRPNLDKAFAFVEANDPHKLSPFNRKKTMTFYELARIAPALGAIVELGAHHGIGTAALWYGARDGHRCKVISVDAYSEMRGWANEPYDFHDMRIWEDNMRSFSIHPLLIRGDVKEESMKWKEPISLLVHDLGMKNDFTSRPSASWCASVVRPAPIHQLCHRHQSLPDQWVRPAGVGPRGIAAPTPVKKVDTAELLRTVAWRAREAEGA